MRLLATVLLFQMIVQLHVAYLFWLLPLLNVNSGPPGAAARPVGGATGRQRHTVQLQRGQQVCQLYQQDIELSRCSSNTV